MTTSRRRPRGAVPAASVACALLLLLPRGAAGAECKPGMNASHPWGTAFRHGGRPACFYDYDSDSNPPGRYCAGIAPVQPARVLTKLLKTCRSKQCTMTWRLCAELCVEAGLLGTAGVEATDECYCSTSDLQGQAHILLPLLSVVV